jgi:hypothetical protein
MAAPSAKFAAPIGPPMEKTFCAGLVARETHTSATVTASLQSLDPLARHRLNAFWEAAASSW